METMNSENKNQSRRRFITWGVTSAAVFSAFRFFSPRKGKITKSGKTVKMLTQDGRLVDVEVAGLTSRKKKITNKELQNWIKK